VPIANHKDKGTHVSARRRASQLSIGLVVMGLHLAGLVAWRTMERGMLWVRFGETRLPSITVWLPALAKPAPQTSLQTHRPQPTPSRSDVPRTREDNKPATPQPTADPATPAPLSAGIPLPTQTSGPIGAQPTVPVTPALNLTLSRKDIISVAPRSFAEQSPFRGRLPKTVERQIANAAAETGPWTEERLDYDRIRFRRGNTCITWHRPNPASIDPLREAAGPPNWLSPGPEECTD
jgi:hypothetical protein